MSKVFLGKFKDYNDEAIGPYVRTCLHSLPHDLAHRRVLIKPNFLMGNDPDHSITTHPRLIEMVVKILLEMKARVWIGDTSGLPVPPRNLARQLGIMDIVDRYGIEFADLTKETGPVTRKENKLVKTFTLSAFIRKMDLILNLPKLKTHVQAVYTGAIKNLFGIVPGILKPQFHVKFPDPRHFGQMIVDLAQIIRPGFTIMDGILAMEGQGPSNGRPKQLGVLISSSDMVAVDTVACSIIGQDPFKVPIVALAYEDGLGEIRLSGIELEGERDIEKLRDRHFILVDPGFDMHFSLTRKVQPLIKQFITPRPFIEKRKCTRCMTCVKVCPVDALSSSKNEVPVFDYIKCIRCYCCHEMCPYQAIVKKENLITRLFFRWILR